MNYEARQDAILSSGVKLERRVTPKRVPCRHCNGTGYDLINVRWAVLHIGTQSFRLSNVEPGECGNGNACSICGGQHLRLKWTNFEQETKYLCVNCLNLLSVMEGEEEKEAHDPSS